MRNLVALAVMPFLALPAFSQPMAPFPFRLPQPTRARLLAHGVYTPPNTQSNGYQLAQYIGPQYYPAQMMGGSSPVVVPPTIVNTQYEHNSSKKSCKESMIDLFLFSVRRTTGDCTP
jgi:hypothetical protein